MKKWHVHVTEKFDGHLIVAADSSEQAQGKVEEAIVTGNYDTCSDKHANYENNVIVEGEAEDDRTPDIE